MIAKYVLLGIGSQRRRRYAVGVAAGILSFALAGCGSSGQPPSAALQTAPEQAPWAALERVHGSLLFMCGRDTLSADVYLKDTGGNVQRLTESPQQFGVTDIDWLGRRIVVVSTREGTELLEIRGLDTPPEAAGQRVTRFAGTPAVSLDGELAFTRVAERRGRMVTEVVRAGRGARRVVARLPAEISWLWWVHGRLYALAESRDRRSALVDVTNRRSHRSTPLRGNVGGTSVSRNGRVAYVQIMRRGLRLNLTRLDGKNRRTFHSRWLPAAWSPNEHQLLVVKRRLIGLMSPRTGKVQRLGRLPCGAMLIDAAWRKTTP